MTAAEEVNERKDDVVAAAVRRQQQILLIHQAPLILSINMVIAILVAGFVSAFIPLWAALSWLGIMLSASALLLFNALRLRARPPPEQVTGRTLKITELWAAGMGLLWGSIIVFFYPEEAVRYQMFLALVFVGLASGLVNMLHPIPRVCGWFAAAIFAPLIVRFITDADALHDLVAVLVFIFFFALMNSSRRGYQKLVTLIESSLELEQARSDFADAIESINDAFAIYGKDGTIKLANEQFKSWFAGCSKLSDVPGRGGLYRMPGGVWVQGSVRSTPDGGYVSVHTDVTALKVRERELIEARLQAEEASNAKSLFLANISHELRTPLNAIMGFAEIMRKAMFGPLGSVKYKQYANDIHDSAGHLLAVINDILNFSKIQSSNYALSFEEVHISDVIDVVVELCKKQMDGFGRNRIDVQIQPDFGSIRADPGALKQILLNLFCNALKFTPPPGRVTVEADVDKHGCPRISVSDTGIGIPKEKLDAIRQPFQQVEGAFQRKFRGTGIGLSIADALVRLHGGELELESEIGVGTRAIIILPAELRITNERARAS